MFWVVVSFFFFFFFNDTATTEIYTLSPTRRSSDLVAVGAFMNRSVPVAQPSSDTVTFAPQSLGTTSPAQTVTVTRSEEHTSELQSPCNLVCRLLLEKKKNYHFLVRCGLLILMMSH